MKMFVPAIWAVCVAWQAGAQTPARLIETEALEITDNSRGDRSPTCNGKYVLWSSHDGRDAEIMLMDLATGETKALTQNQVDDVSPAAGERYAVWMRRTGGVFRPVVYDFLAQTEAEVVWNEPTSAFFPAVWGDMAVWQAGDSTDAEVYLYHIPTRRLKRLTQDRFYDGKPAIGDDNVVWNAGAAGDYMVMHYSIKDERTRRISAPGKTAWGAVTAATHAAWQSDAQNFTLYHFKTQKTEKIMGENPVIWHDTILYAGVGAERGTLFLLRLSDMRTEKVEADVRQLYETCFCGTAAVWRYFDGRDHEIGGLRWRPPQSPEPEIKEDVPQDVPAPEPAAALPVSAVAALAPSALIYPNPADRLVTVSLEPGVRTPAQVTLYAPDGRVVKKAVVAPLQSESFELTAVASLPYSMEIKVEGNTYLKKVWVKGH